MKRLFLLLIASSYALCGDCGCPAEETCPPPEPWCPIMPQMECDYGVYIDAEFLYFFSQGNELPWALRYKSTPETPGSTSGQGVVEKIFSLQTSWDPGVRVGLGWKTPTYPWDLYLVWTSYYTRRKESASVDPLEAANPANIVGARWLESGWLDTSEADEWSKISTDWAVRINYFDLQLANVQWRNRYTKFRPFIGLRGGWTKEWFLNEGVRDLEADAPPAIEKRRTHQKQNFWGVGLLVGFDSAWHITKNFAIFGDASGSLLWGRFDFDRTERYFERESSGSISEDWNGKSTDDFYSMQPIIDLAIGLRWDQRFSNNRYQLRLDIGWEQHLWLEHTRMLEYAEINSGTVVSQRAVRANELLSFAGLVARVRFDF